MGLLRDLGKHVYRHYRPWRDPLDVPLTTLPRTAEAFRRLHPTALLFDRIRVKRRLGAVVVLIPAISQDLLSAGPMTALRFAATMSDQTARPLRVFTTNRFGPTAPGAEENLRSLLGRPEMEIVHIGAGETAEAGAEDLWLATYWTTALALDVAVRSGVLDSDKVVYLVQDYEPCFYAWSTAWASAQSTYRAGFHVVANSQPLADYLSSHEGVLVAPELVLGPDLDMDRLKAVAANREIVRDGEAVDVFCYARPGVQRNLFDLALAAATRASDSTERPWRLLLAGENFDTPKVSGVDVVNLGRTDTRGYYELMQRTPVALSLMLSPHPSHPPLDWAISGATSVTNSFGPYKSGLHPRIVTAPAHPDAIGRLLASTINSAHIADFQPLPRPLGRPMAEVVRAVVSLCSR